jgi:hypothetical protein
VVDQASTSSAAVASATTTADRLIVELERALLDARAQQALIRASLSRVIEQLDPTSSG